MEHDNKHIDQFDKNLLSVATVPKCDRQREGEREREISRHRESSE